METELDTCTKEDKMIIIHSKLDALGHSLCTIKHRRTEVTNVQRDALVLARRDEPITYASMCNKDMDNESHNVLTNCTSAIKSLDTTEVGTYKSIKLIHEAAYGTYIENPKPTETYGQIKLFDFKLSQSILGKEDPLKAAEFISAL